MKPTPRLDWGLCVVWAIALISFGVLYAVVLCPLIVGIAR